MNDDDDQGTVAFTCGAFDLLHWGHVSFLKACGELADHLVVCMNSDYSVKKLKGLHRPIIPEFERKQMLLALDCVDDVIIFDELDAAELIREYRPQFFIKGYEYKDKDIPEFRAAYEARAQIVVIEPEDYEKGIHTSAIIRRIMEKEMLR